MRDVPNFAAWNTEVLAQFAAEAYVEMQTQHDTIEQLRKDNRDLSKINRELLTKGESNENKRGNK